MPHLIKQSDPNEPEAYSINAGARKLSVGRGKIYQMERDGLIRLIRLGGRTLVPRSEIKRLVGDVR